MKDYLDIGPSPPDESCVPLGSEDYHRKARKECRAYIAQLRRALGDEPLGSRLAIRSNSHDFGVYLSVVCEFDDLFEEAVDYAYRCESEGPLSWDDEARRELSQHP